MTAPQPDLITDLASKREALSLSRNQVDDRAGWATG